MEKVIGIRREDKNKWERRVPLVPDDVRELKEKFGIKTIIQPSPIRAFTDDQYRNAGAEVSDDLSKATVILAVKEIPETLFEENKTYIFFSHTIKGQPNNMGMLKRLMDMKCNLIDYERIVDEHNRRLIFFGRYAGLAGMVDTLHAFGQKLKLQGYQTPLEKIKPAYQYESVEGAKNAFKEIGEEIDETGLPDQFCPVVIGFTGYGNVSRGAQEIFDLLPHKVISGLNLVEMYENFTTDKLNFYKVVFKEEDMVQLKEPAPGPFQLQDYYQHPEKYVSRFDEYLPYLSVLVNCIYWTEDYPRLVTREYLDSQFHLRSHLTLKVIGDISCDINGSVEITHKATLPDVPCFTYFGPEGRFEDGVQRSGVSVMAVDNLPCEFPRESSIGFSTVLKNFVNDMVTEDFNRDFSGLALPNPLKTALILKNGKLTGDYSYLKEHVE